MLLNISFGLIYFKSLHWKKCCFTWKVTDNCRTGRIQFMGGGVAELQYHREWNLSSPLYVGGYVGVYVGGSYTLVLVYTDHNPLTFLSRMCNSNQCLMRWSLIVQEYNLEIRQKKGLENVKMSHSFLWYSQTHCCTTLNEI